MNLLNVKSSTFNTMIRQEFLMIPALLRKLSLLCITLFFTLSPSHAANDLALIASVDKNPVALYDSVVLTVLANDDIDSDALNLAPLLANFTLGRTSVSKETRSINFKSSQLTRWTTVITPKKSGTFTIPALTIKTDRTQPISLSVLPENSNNAGQAKKDVYLEASVSNKKSYVQEVFTLSVKVFINSQVSLNRATLTEPSMPGAEITAVKNDIESQEVIDGKHYNVIERLFSVRPQQSGDFELIPPRFSGSAVVPSSNNRGGFYRQTTPINTGTKNIKVNIRPIPSDYKGAWLPSDIVTLHQEWQPAPSNFKVGEPITRIITLNVKGVAKEQLPLIDFSVPKGLKVYPDKAQRNATATSRGFVSQQVRSFAVVANTPGSYTLPAVSIPWWNTVTHQIEHAQLPAQNITVLPNDDIEYLTNNQQQMPFAGSDIFENNLDCTPAEETTNTDGDLATDKSNDMQKWLYLSLWLATLLAWGGRSYWNKHHQSNMTSPATYTSSKTNLTTSARLKALVDACEKNQADIAHKNLLPWLKGLCTDASDDINVKQVSSIDEVIKALNQDELTTAVKALQQALYGSDTAEARHWSGDALLKVINQLNVKTKQGDNKSERDFSLNP